MKKNPIAMILLLALMIPALAGCGTQKPTATETGAESTNVVTPAGSRSGSQPVSQTGSETVPTTENGGVIVVFFSCTGNTEPIAESIKDELNADIYEIRAKVPYTDDDIRYDADTRAYKEQHDPAARPEIDGELPDLSAYDTVYLGYPIWHGEAPKIVYTFLEGVDMSGKTVVPFCTSAESPVGSSADNLHALAPGAVWKDGTRFAIGTTREIINEWLKQS